MKYYGKIQDPKDLVTKEYTDQKYTKPNTGIPDTDLADAVRTSLGKADTALQEHQSLAAYRTSAAQDAIDATKLNSASKGVAGGVAELDANGKVPVAQCPIEEDVAQATTDWLDEHVVQETGYVIDDSLTVSGAAADAKKVGDEVADLKNYTNNQITNNILSEYDDNFPLKNSYIDKNGVIRQNNLWCTTDYVKVTPLTYYQWSNSPPEGWFFVAYDINKQRIWGYNGYTANNFATSDTWEYMRFSLPNEYAENAKLYENFPTLLNYGKTAFNACGMVLTVGQGRMYERLRDGVNAARRLPAAKVIIYPGTYDLTTEFSTELSSSGIDGILLSGNLHLLFLPGSYVTCEFSDRSHEKFQPFYVAFPTNDASVQASNITIEGLNIKAKNCRYCVHDEMSTRTLPYSHKFINCNMSFTCDLTSPKYVQCIGGGLGINGNIVVDGGIYNVDTLYGFAHIGGDGQNCQQCITYHNPSAANAKSSVRIFGVLLKDRGYFRLGYYGSSTEKSVVCVSGCKTGLPTLKMAENSTASIDNIELNEWNEEHTIQGHWELTNAYTAQFVPDS